jgi:phosphopantothenoylcysteine decarboxylase/phosphopantothenate--cysteine ligase
MALIALGVTGGIGAYKAVEIARGLQKGGHDVTAIMTRSARRFVGELTFEAITRRRVITSQYAPGANADIEHIALATDAKLLLVAPATANVIGKFANGIADDFLTSLYLATRAPVLMAPAMNTNMLEHEAVRRNLATLAARGVQFVEPGAGYLACGWIGKGRLAEPEDIVAAAERILKPTGSLLGRLVVVTAGPTQEDLDQVRYIGNRSSGRMGYALAAEAARRGARVVLVSGPTSLEPPIGLEVVHVRSAVEMQQAVQLAVRDADLVVMAAAVADFRPIAPVEHKLKKHEGPPQIVLEPTPDILAGLGAGKPPGQTLVGFAAETDDLESNAMAKLTRKRLDLIVANDVGAEAIGFQHDTNAVTLFAVGEPAVTLPLADKRTIAAGVLDRIVAMRASAG